MHDYILSVAQELFDEKLCVDIDEIAATAGVKAIVVRAYLPDPFSAPLAVEPVPGTARVR
ncbi:hypothetical protein [Amycolatopsis minnesotensis]|uniref:TetR family transcriptional regulator n=1 Tax=Amycolatopsis minnesotensis TaxID=337894 RepID=A0ABP5DDY4_9PSEU